MISTALLIKLKSSRKNRNHNIVTRLLPLFPLQLVVVPGNPLPLHIFEPRYREMVGEADRNGTEFGIVLAREGGIVNIGCTVRVDQILEHYPDGRFDVMTRGERRFQILSVNQELAYLRGEVEYFEDQDWTRPPQDLILRALDAFNTLKRSLEESGGKDQGIDPDPEHPRLSFQLAQAVDDLEFQSRILRSRSEIERLTEFTKFTATHIERREYAARLKKAIPTNGHGHKHIDI